MTDPTSIIHVVDDSARRGLPTETGIANPTTNETRVLVHFAAG